MYNKDGENYNKKKMHLKFKGVQKNRFFVVVVFYFPEYPILNVVK